jgi:hypothetical protein
MNKAINEKYTALAEKHRKALAIIDELKRRLSGSAVPTQVKAPAAAAVPMPSDDDMAPGESTLVLDNPMLKKPN